MNVTPSSACVSSPPPPCSRPDWARCCRRPRPRTYPGDGAAGDAAEPQTSGALWSTSTYSGHDAAGTQGVFHTLEGSGLVWTRCADGSSVPLHRVTGDQVEVTLDGGLSRAEGLGVVGDWLVHRPGGVRISSPSPSRAARGDAADLVEPWRIGSLRRVSLYADWKTYKKIVGVGDLIAQDRSNNLYRYYGRGNGTFTARVKLSANWGGSYNVVVGVGDITGDGKADIPSRDTLANLYRNNGNGKGSFASRVKIGTGWIRGGLLARGPATL